MGPFCKFINQTPQPGGKIARRGADQGRIRQAAHRPQKPWVASLTTKGVNGYDA